MDYYHTLGVNHTTDAKGIKNAYRKLASKHHPDKGGDQEEFKKIQKAYDVLGDAKKRAEYDNPSPFGGGQNPFGDGNPFGDIFGDIFGQRPKRRGPQPTPMFRTQLNVTLRQSYTGDTQTLELNTPQGKKVIQVTIPKGVTTGQQTRYDNVVEQGTSLIIDFHVMNDSWFERMGNNLLCSHNISVLDLIVGTQFNFTTISGKVLKVSVRPGTQPGTQIKLTGQGMPITDRRGPNFQSGNFGDQIILLNGFIPDTIEQGVVDAIKKYKDIQDLKQN
jgi:curved DNA-binding protein